jgi:pimeloyl-ACP methyl ester carboxylesterase
MPTIHNLNPTRMLKIWVIFALLICIPGEVLAESRTKPSTIVIVHGAWGGAWQFAKIDPLLRDMGYEVHRVTLTGLGERNHLATLDTGLETHITDVINVIKFEQLHDIILIGHSYGGMVITGVVDRMPERIAQVIYLDAMLPQNGESAISLMRERGKALLDRADKGFIAPWWVRPDKSFPIDVPHPVKAFTDIISLNNSAAKSVPGAFILTVESGKEPSENDFYFHAQRAHNRGWNVVTMEGDHNPHWRQPSATVEVIKQVISSFEKK